MSFLSFISQELEHDKRLMLRRFPATKVRKTAGAVSGFTLMEILIVVAILAILITLALPIYRKTIQEAKDKEAKTMLRLIHEAEEMYRLEKLTYTDCGDSAECNSILHLSLSSKTWDYSIPDAQLPPATETFCVEARDNVANRSWYMRKTDSEPAQGNCP